MVCFHCSDDTVGGLPSYVIVRQIQASQRRVAGHNVVQGDGEGMVMVRSDGVSFLLVAEGVARQIEGP